MDRYIGFWAGPQEDERRLPRASDHIDKSMPDDLRKVVIQYLNLERHSRINHQKGYSTCRICKKIVPGSCEVTDGEYIWPSGYVHYIQKHSVAPPPRLIKKAYKWHRGKKTIA